MNNEIYSRCEIFIANKSNVTIDANEGNKKKTIYETFCRCAIPSQAQKQWK